MVHTRPVKASDNLSDPLPLRWGELPNQISQWPHILEAFQQNCRTIASSLSTVSSGNGRWDRQTEAP